MGLISLRLSVRIRKTEAEISKEILIEGSLRGVVKVKFESGLDFGVFMF